MMTLKVTCILKENIIIMSTQIKVGTVRMTPSAYPRSGYGALSSCCNLSDTTPHHKDSINSKMVDPTSLDAASILLCFQKAAASQF
jgi:hypothetical protein